MNLHGTAVNDTHDSVDEEDGGALLTFDPVSVTGVAIQFEMRATHFNHYKVHEFEVYAVAIPLPLSS